MIDNFTDVPQGDKGDRTVTHFRPFTTGHTRGLANAVVTSLVNYLYSGKAEVAAL